VSNRLSYLIPLKAVKEFLDDVYGGDMALVDVDLLGDGFVTFLGKELPEKGIVSLVAINLPGDINIQELYPLLKNRKEIEDV
jgi:hypothetical protein